MRIDDWSSDVCSSECPVVALEIGARIEHFLSEEASVKVCVEIVVMLDVVLAGERIVECEQLAEQRADTPSLHAMFEAGLELQADFENAQQIAIGWLTAMIDRKSKRLNSSH